MNGDTFAPIRRVEDVIFEYLDCGGMIESGSSFDFAVKVLEESGSGIKRMGVKNFLNPEKNIGLSYEQAVERNSKLTLEEMRTILIGRYGPRMYSDKIEVGERLQYMSEFVQCGGVIKEFAISMDEINQNPEYLQLFQEIWGKSKENSSAREQESKINPGDGDFISPEIDAEINSWFTEAGKPLPKREAELASLEAEERAITEAEALISKQSQKTGEQK